MNRKLTRYIVSISLTIMLLAIPITSAGCEEEKLPPPSPSPSPTTIDLSSTLVPNTDLDVYVYAKQENPTTVPKDMIDTPFDLNVASMALWGIPTDEDFTFGGALTLTSDADASKIHAQITPREDIWTALIGRTIYFVHGSGTAAQTMKTAISNKDFKYYDDEKALEAVASLPNEGKTKLAAVAIGKPSKALVKRITQNADAEAAGMIDTLLSLAQLEVIAGGMYAPQQIDIAELIKGSQLDGIREAELGIIILVKSRLPGFVVSPMVKKFLEEAEYQEVNLGGITVYKGFLDEHAQKIPMLIRIEDNRIFLALSGQESYAQTLITSIKK